MDDRPETTDSPSLMSEPKTPMDAPGVSPAKFADEKKRKEPTDSTLFKVPQSPTRAKNTASTSAPSSSGIGVPRLNRPPMLTVDTTAIDDVDSPPLPAYAKGWRIFAKDDNGHFWYRIGTYRFTNKTEALLFDRGPEAMALPSDASGGAPPKRAAEASERAAEQLGLTGERRASSRRAASLATGRLRETDEAAMGDEES